MIYSNDDQWQFWQWKLQGRIITVSMTHMTEKQYVPYAVLFEPEHYYINDDEECIGCSECVRKSDVMY